MCQKICVNKTNLSHNCGAQASVPWVHRNHQKRLFSRPCIWFAPRRKDRKVKDTLGTATKPSVISQKIFSWLQCLHKLQTSNSKSLYSSGGTGAIECLPLGSEPDSSVSSSDVRTILNASSGSLPSELTEQGRGFRARQYERVLPLR